MEKLVVPESTANPELVKRGNLIYCGELNKNKEFQGFGALYDLEKLKFYEGSFLNGKKHGRGRNFVVSGPNFGHVYEGEYVQDRYCGHGKYRWPDGDIYTGWFKDDQRDGLGTLIEANGS